MCLVYNKRSINTIWLLLLLGAQMVKCLFAMRETQVGSLGWEELLKKEMATHSSTPGWKIPRIEEPGGLQSMGSQRVGHDWATSLHSMGNTKSMTLRTFPPGTYKLAGEKEMYTAGREARREVMRDKQYNWTDFHCRRVGKLHSHGSMGPEQDSWNGVAKRTSGQVHQQMPCRQRFPHCGRWQPV